MNAVAEHRQIAEALPPEPVPVDSEAWRTLLARRYGAGVRASIDASSLSPPSAMREAVVESNRDGLIDALYGPLCEQASAQGFVVAHLAQSLDGRIATLGGVSRWLSGDEDLLHTHRMRALADAVVVGVGTVLQDDPQLTVRRCTGPHPVRVVIDAEFRLDGSQRVFTDPVSPTLLLVAADRVDGQVKHGQADVIAIERSADGGLDPVEIRRVLIERGLRCLFVEGGGATVSRFLRAGQLDRLQLTIAPVILGSGRPPRRTGSANLAR